MLIFGCGLLKIQQANTLERLFGLASSTILDPFFPLVKIVYTRTFCENICGDRIAIVVCQKTEERKGKKTLAHPTPGMASCQSVKKKGRRKDKAQLAISS